MDGRPTLPIPLAWPTAARNWLLTGAILVVAVSSLAGLVAALLAVLRGRERGLLVLLPILWGLVVVFFPALALAFPR